MAQLPAAAGDDEGKSSVSDARLPASTLPSGIEELTGRRVAGPQRSVCGLLLRPQVWGSGIWTAPPRRSDGPRSLEIQQYGLRTGVFSGTFQAFIECIQADDQESVLKTIGEAAMKFGT